MNRMVGLALVCGLASSVVRAEPAAEPKASTLAAIFAGSLLSATAATLASTYDRTGTGSVAYGSLAYLAPPLLSATLFGALESLPVPVGASFLGTTASSVMGMLVALLAAGNPDFRQLRTPSVEAPFAFGSALLTSLGPPVALALIGKRASRPANSKAIAFSILFTTLATAGAAGTTLLLAALTLSWPVAISSGVLGAAGIAAAAWGGFRAGGGRPNYFHAVAAVLVSLAAVGGAAFTLQYGGAVIPSVLPVLFGASALVLVAPALVMDLAEERATVDTKPTVAPRVGVVPLRDGAMLAFGVSL